MPEMHQFAGLSAPLAYYPLTNMLVSPEVVADRRRQPHEVMHVVAVYVGVAAKKEGTEVDHDIKLDGNNDTPAGELSPSD